MMTKNSTVILILALAACASQPAPESTPAPAATAAASASAPAPRAADDEGGFDAEMAKRLGADEYGMKPYVMALLEAGPNRSTDKEEVRELMRAHLDNIKRMADEGSLVMAGPFLDEGQLRGIYIFNVATVDEARALTATDPAIQAGSLVMKLRPWYGSAALQEVNDLHKRISATSI